MLRRRNVAGALVLSALMVGCSNTDGWVQSSDPDAWSQWGGSSSNANYRPTAVDDDLAQVWSRPVVGTSSAGVTVSERGYIAVTATTENGCNFFNWQEDTGRMRWCRRNGIGTELQSVTQDQFDNTYLGEPGWAISYNPDTQLRWRTRVGGYALWTKLAGDGKLLVASTNGTLSLLGTHNGEPEATPLNSLGPVGGDSTDQQLATLDDCPTEGPGCALAKPPAVDPEAKRAFVVGLVGDRRGVFATDFATPAARDDADGLPNITPTWNRTDIGDVTGAPVLAADAKTLYVATATGTVFALNAENGETRWQADRVVGGQDAGAPLSLSVSPDGTVVVGSATNTGIRLVTIDKDGAVRTPEANTAVVASPVALLGEDRAYAVTSDSGKLSAAIIKVSDGTVISSVPLPAEIERVSGIAVGPDGELLVAGGSKTGKSADGDVSGLLVALR